MKTIYIITGGTMVHVTPHFSLCAPAYGKVGADIYSRMVMALDDKRLDDEYRVFLIKTKMAGINSDETKEQLNQIGFHSSIETNDNLELFIRTVISKPETVSIIMAAAICDFTPDTLTGFEDTKPVSISEFGKDKKRLHQAHSLNLKLNPSKKIIDIIKEKRPDMFLVTFNTTAGSTENELVTKALYNLKRSGSDLVFGNDIQNQTNIVVTPENQTFCGEDRESTLDIFCAEIFNRIR